VKHILALNLKNQPFRQRKEGVHWPSHRGPRCQRQLPAALRAAEHRRNLTEIFLWAGVAENGAR